jgi:(E)-4-hydroxy-3-methylbut-2-enyl-diphosphate synthase
MELLTYNKQYCVSLTTYERFSSRVVKIGDLYLGGNNPIRIQSMTTTDTMDTDSTVAQAIRMIEAGSEIVRITAPSVKEARNLETIKTELRKRGYNTPICADIHFKREAAEIAARIVEKVRINPGNYADRKRFKVFTYTDEMYKQELERIYREFAPLVKICKEYGTAMRIGTNHGSLSDRIMNRYGDTPLGMVESALEFVRICEDLDYHDIVLSMKASNPQIMIQAYRLLVSRMIEEGMNYPLHLGVTEAGDGEDGRIKSAVGICTLLEDGLGDTIRVSLTEEPEYELPVCRKIADRYSRRLIEMADDDPIPVISDYPIDPYSYKRRSTLPAGKIGGSNVPVVIISMNSFALTGPEVLGKIGYEYSSESDKWNIRDAAADFIYLGSHDIDFNLPGTVNKIHDFGYWMGLENKYDSHPLYKPEEFINSDLHSTVLNFLEVYTDDIYKLGEAFTKELPLVLILKSRRAHAMPDLRRAIIELISRDIRVPVILKREYQLTDPENLLLYSSADIGGLLIDGLGDGLWIESAGTDLQYINRISFGILQATRTRISKTEYISCPSCGRTQFDLQETTAMIKQRTSHLKGIKIAIMGCIVNGPGEMADADYGFVGSGPGWVSLYRGKEVIKRGIPYSNALDELIELMKQDGVWKDN